MPPSAGELPGQTRLGAPNKPVQLITIATFISLLAGQFTLDRIGLPSSPYLPERLIAVFILLAASTFFASQDGAIRQPPVVLPITAAVLPTIYLMVTAFWAPPFADLNDALVDLVALAGYCLIIGVLAKWDLKTTQTTLMWCLVLTSILFSAAGLANAEGHSRVAAFGGGPNVYGRITVLGVVGLVWLVSTKRLSVWGLCLAPAMLAATVASGSRGGMLAGIVSLFLVLGLVIKIGVGRLILAILILSLAGAAAYHYVGDTINRTVQGRIVTLTFEENYTSGRGPLLSTALDMFHENPGFGAGLRSFAATYGHGFTYPHNLFVQVAAEGGSVGLALLAIFLGKFTLAAYRQRRSRDVRCWTAAALVILTSAMFSGDYYDARFFWVFALVAIASARIIGTSPPDSVVGNRALRTYGRAGQPDPTSAHLLGPQSTRNHPSRPAARPSSTRRRGSTPGNGTSAAPAPWSRDR